MSSTSSQFNKRANTALKYKYISRKQTDMSPAFKRWKKHYEKELDDMYCIVIDNMEMFYPDVNLIKDKYFELFCNLIYQKSTKLLI